MKMSIIPSPVSFFILALALISCSTNEKNEIVIGPGAGIHHDDFEYSVENFAVLKSIDGTAAAGNFYIVTFKVVNHAIRVNHEWDNSVAYIIDEDENVYENNVELQKKLEAKEPFGFEESYVTPFQSQTTTRMVFELPASVRKPYLKVRGETLMGDFLDGNQFERTHVKLF